ncbi:Protein phosphatase 2C-related protein [Cordyceps militaris CM01]|uniref:Protein phosphatase n=1 Tax=Cordyceps militaris (strain CM01) TaxID=983644 RepID=G3JK65_CORMM|nr:Protein phosphatase 2C-related protein [Cordyceps militaris CM01]EGX92195.1 Protein phosphatase 2C-related protein [Cordyceps militaris CM01]
MRILRRPAPATKWRSPPPLTPRPHIVLISSSRGRRRPDCPRAHSTLAQKQHSPDDADDAAQRSDDDAGHNDQTTRRPLPHLPFRFETGIGVFAKRPPRPFPPPFLSRPSASFSDPLSTHRAVVDGEAIRGLTNGDDAIYASDYFICANDGVGAWATRPRGHAGYESPLPSHLPDELWARLILHFWSAAIDEDLIRAATAKPARADPVDAEPHPVAALSAAYKKTLEATEAHDWQGTTTACGAQLHYATPSSGDGGSSAPTPLLYVTNLGDCQVMVVRPRDRSVVFKTTEQWHWFDCPRQLGTNSPDTPETNAVVDRVALQVGDVVLAMSDGVIDNLWTHEIVDIVAASIEGWEKTASPSRRGGRDGGMRQAAQDLVAAARNIALDPYAQSPFMEHAIEEGLASEGGKMDDISVVAALCVENSQEPETP